MQRPQTLEELARLGPQSSDASLFPYLEAYRMAYASASSHTSRAKRLDLERFIQFAQGLTGKKSARAIELSVWTPSVLQDYVNTLLRQGEAPSTVSRRLATLKHVGRILCERIPGFSNPLREIRSPRAQEICPKALSQKDVERILAKARELRRERPNFLRLRNHTIIEILLDTGLRADEVRLLRRAQLSDDLQWFLQVRTKGNKFRDVYISSESRKILHEYLSARRKELGRYCTQLSSAYDRKLPLFISNYRIVADQAASFELGEKTLWRIVRTMGRELKIHPHILRHTFALGLLNHTNDIRLVAQALGHSSVQTTMRYTERTREDIAEAIERLRGKHRSGSTP